MTESDNVVILKNLSFTQSLDGLPNPLASNHGLCVATLRFDMLNLCLDNNSEESGLWRDQKYIDRLASFLEKLKGKSDHELRNAGISMLKIFAICCYRVPVRPPNPVPGSGQAPVLHSEHHLSLGFQKGYFWQKLVELLPNPRLKVVGKLSITFDRTNSFQDFNTTTFSNRTEIKDGVSPRFYYDAPIAGLAGASDEQLRRQTLFLKIDSISLEWSTNSLLEEAARGSLAAEILHQLFLQEDSKDFKVVAGTGAEFRCHSMVLQTHGPVFAAMMNAAHEMKEAKSKRVKMSEFSEETVDCFIRYLYAEDISPGKISCKLGLELLQLAHRYELKRLEDSVTRFISSRNLEWFNPDTLLRFYFFLRNLPEYAELKSVILQRMDSLSKDIRSSKCFRQLSKEDTEEIMWELLDFSKAKRAKLDDK